MEGSSWSCHRLSDHLRAWVESNSPEDAVRSLGLGRTLSNCESFDRAQDVAMRKAVLYMPRAYFRRLRSCQNQVTSRVRKELRKPGLKVVRDDDHLSG